MLPAIPPELQSALPAIQSWANRHPNIARLWIFGSRVGGTHKPESDIDLAIEIDASGSDTTALLMYLERHETWQAELQNAFHYPVDLEIYDPAHVVVVRAVDHGGLLVYER
jgi:predicted nucleotidyltransferase